MIPAIAEADAAEIEEKGGYLPRFRHVISPVEPASNSIHPRSEHRLRLFEGSNPRMRRQRFANIVHRKSGVSRCCSHCDLILLLRGRPISLYCIIERLVILSICHGGKQR